MQTVEQPDVQTPLPRVKPQPLPVASTSVVATGVIVFVANAGLLILQLVAGRHLAPFVGSSLETWTAVIGVFLLGIASGNAYGGKLADTAKHPKLLALVLTVGALASAWLAVAPMVIHNVASSLPLSIRIPVLALVFCFPSGFVLSLLTPLAIKQGLPDVKRAGRTVGRVFALGTLGCLVGNYVTGFVLFSAFTINTITYAVAGALLALAIFAYAIMNTPRSHSPLIQVQILPGPLSLRQAFALVFACSFAGMALELTATRLLAQVFGVSLFTWTGVIGVMLAGTATGNTLGGWLADRTKTPAFTLAKSLIGAGAATVSVIVSFIVAGQVELFATGDILWRIIGWSFALFFLPMMMLGTISPQVIRLAVADVGSAGRVAGRVYAWSTAGAIVGTFAAGYVLIAQLGMLRVILLAAVLPCLAAFAVAPLFKKTSYLYSACLVLGGVLAGAISLTPQSTNVAMETNYYAIYVREAKDDSGIVIPNQHVLVLDSLIHSRVDLSNPTFLFYQHEKIQLDILKWKAKDTVAPKVLVVGGGAYTYPRCVKTLYPQCQMDVVEIDPGVTAISYARLGLDPALGIRSIHQDGRQFVAEGAVKGTYDLITLDAVNDLSVPSHLLTKEFNDAAKQTLAPNGVYLLTVIDTPAVGHVWRAAVRTLQQSYAHVQVLTPMEKWNPEEQTVLVIYAADVPLDFAKLSVPKATFAPPAAEVNTLLNEGKPIVLTDQFAPVDQMMAEVFRRRKINR